METRRHPMRFDIGTFAIAAVDLTMKYKLWLSVSWETWSKAEEQVIIYLQGEYNWI